MKPLGLIITRSDSTQNSYSPSSPFFKKNSIDTNDYLSDGSQSLSESFENNYHLLFFSPQNSNLFLNNSESCDNEVEFKPITRKRSKTIDFDELESKLFRILEIDIPKDSSQLKDYLVKHDNTIKKIIHKLFEKFNIKDIKIVTIAEINKKFTIHITFDSYPKFNNDKTLKEYFSSAQSRLQEIQNQSDESFSINYHFN